MIFYSINLSFSYLSKSIKFPNFSLEFIIHFDQNFNKFFENTLILCEVNPYSPLYYLIHDYLSKLVSLELVLKSLCVYSTTLRIRLLSSCIFPQFFLFIQKSRNPEIQKSKNNSSSQSLTHPPCEFDMNSSLFQILR